LKELEDTNSLAGRIVAQATGQPASSPPPVQPPVREKNAAAVALDKLGASKGGVTRALKHSRKDRNAIANKAYKSL
jgi:hypothetical protein